MKMNYEGLLTDINVAFGLQGHYEILAIFLFAFMILFLNEMHICKKKCQPYVCFKEITKKFDFFILLFFF